MDTYTQLQSVTPMRRYLALEEKRRIVEETLVECASVSGAARARGLNAILVFNWRQRYQKGLLCSRGAAKLLPVKVIAESSPGLTASLGEACTSVITSEPANGDQVKTGPGMLSCATEQLSRHRPLASRARMDMRKITSEDPIRCLSCHRTYVRKHTFARESS